MPEDEDRSSGGNLEPKGQRGGRFPNHRVSGLVQLTKDNNGHLQATFTYMRRFGFDSDRTLTRAIQELIAHGMIYRTRMGGYQQGASQYAVTWLPIKWRDGLFLDGFLPCAWRKWEPIEKKSPPSKMRCANRKNGGWTGAATVENAVSSPVKSTDNELMPGTTAKSSETAFKRSRSRPGLVSTNAIRLTVAADRGMLRLVA